MMQPITGIARNQMVFTSVEEGISKDNPVRFIDAFVENIDLKTLGFELRTLKKKGRPSFNTKIFLKIYLFLKQKNKNNKPLKGLKCFAVR